jgi:hypothetical protein
MAYIMAEDCHSSSKKKKRVPKIKGSHFYSRAKAKTPNTTSHFLYLAHKEMVDLLVLYHWWLYKIMHKTDQNVICKSKAPTFPNGLEKRRDSHSEKIERRITLIKEKLVADTLSNNVPRVDRPWCTHEG